MPEHAGFLVVDHPLAGMLLTDFLGRSLPDRHPLDLRQLVQGGGVELNGAPCPANRRLQAGDVVRVLRPVPPRPPATGPEPPEVLGETDSALVVAKPAGLPTVPDRSGRDRGVHGLLAALRPADDLRIVHRLDRDTSGCLLLAKGLAAARHFDEQFRRGLVQKTYVALVHGVPAAAAFEIDAWLGPDRRRPGKVVASDRALRGFRAARTTVALRRAFAAHALLALQPHTGRSHQLRVHLQSVGHAIVGDRDYGGEPLLLSSLKSGYKRRPGMPERPLLQRMFLHAEAIACLDLDGRRFAARAPLPEDLAVPLRHLEHSLERRRQPCD